MNDENIRCKKFLSGSSFEKVVREYSMRLVQDHLQFLHKECRTMVQKELREGTEEDGDEMEQADLRSTIWHQIIIASLLFLSDFFSKVIL